VRVLIIDNTLDRDSWGSESLRRFVTASQDRTVFVRRSPHGDLPKTLSSYDRIILSGSRKSCLETGDWAADVDQLLKTGLDRKKPILGVCYGHQALARVLGAPSSLRESLSPEFGWIEIERTAESPLFSGLPDRFWSFASHHEEVIAAPPGCFTFARSERCGIQAFQTHDGGAYGIQFHPERGLKAAEETIAAWPKQWKRAGVKASVLNPDAGKRVFDAEVGTKIFENFLKRI
jgi:GMP synthase (glutamine-hydrolysing)